MSSLVENISDTARWVAIFRAEESERPDAVFHDPFARKLAGKKGEQIANAIGFGRDNSWSFIARTFLFDEFVMRHVLEGYDMVLNLAAGLDARPYRMDLPSSLQWVEVDLPGIIEEKEKVLNNEAPRCNLIRIKSDLADQKARIELFKKLNSKAEKILAARVREVHSRPPGGTRSMPPSWWPPPTARRGRPPGPPTACRPSRS